MPLEGGGETAFGVVVRADSIRNLTDAGWRALADYGVRRAVDLRSDGEVALDSPAEIPIDVVHLPVNGDEVDAVRAWASMPEAYAGLLERFAPQFAGAISTIARAEGPVVVHCHAGRDRTGLVSALVLRLAGVELHAIAAEHARSDDYLAPWWEPWYAEAPNETERERRIRVTQMPADAMATVLGEIDVREYLRAAGTSEEDLDTLVIRLRR